VTQARRAAGGRAALLLLCSLVLAACAGRAPVEGPRPEYFDYDYDFSGSIEGRGVSGTIRFVEHDIYPLEYTLTTEQGICRNYLRSLTEPRIYLNCHGLFIEFVRGGQVLDQAAVTLRTTRAVERQECANWAVNPQTGQRTCTSWRTVSTREPVTQNGWVEIRRLVGGTALGDAPA
jgi:hypothetical protein